MRAMIAVGVLALFGCAPQVPMGEMTRRIFAAQVEVGAASDGASQLTTEEVRAILGTAKKADAQKANPLLPTQGMQVVPLNQDASSQ